MPTEIETRADTLRGVLNGFGIELEPSACVDIIDEVSRHPKYNAPAPSICGNQTIADQYAGELLDAASELNYEKFVLRTEDKYRVIYPEREFIKDMEGFDKLGRNIRRDLMGCIECVSRVGDDRYDNQIRYLWRVVFENSEELLMVGIYHKDGVHYIGAANVL